MGGPMVIYTAALKPDRVGAAASFHGGGVGTDKPNSPHLLIPATNAGYLFAIAEDDDKEEPNEKELLKASLETRKQWRSEARRVGEECGSTCRFGVAPYHSK